MSAAEELNILKEQLRSGNEETRRLAVPRLVLHPLMDVKGELFRALGDDSWRVRKEAVDTLLSISLPDGLVDELISQLRSHDNAGLRNSSVEVLTKLGPLAVAPLLAHAEDADHDVRKFVLDILGDIGERSAAPALIKALSDSDLNVSAAAAENLGKMGDPKALLPLVNALEKSDIWLRHTILEALARIGKPVSISAIAPLAAEKLLKKAVFDCLGAIGGKESAQLLVEGLKERMKNAREAAASSLMKIRDRLPADVAEKSVDGLIRELKGSPYVEGLISSLESTDRGVQESVIRILGVMGDERAAVGLLRGCRDERLRRHCLYAFKSIGESSAASLMDIFPAAQDEERCFIAYLCGEMGFKGGASMLAEGMEDPMPLLRRASVLAAGKVGSAVLLPQISSLLDDDDPDVREGAIDALARFAKTAPDGVRKIAFSLSTSDMPEKRRDSAILFGALGDHEKLSLLIKDEDPDVRKSAVTELAGLRLNSSVNHLVMALVDEDPDVRIVAAGALGDMGVEEAMEPLRLSLKDDDPWVRCAALKSLACLGGEKALEGIVSMLDDEAGIVVIAALNALVETSGPASFDVVAKALENPDEEVVKTAIDILSGGGDAWVEAYMETLLSHPHWDVRRSFIMAMAELWGAKAVPRLARAMETEGDELVKGLMSDILDRFQ